MKRILYLALVMVVALFTSCNKEETVTLVGSWEATDASYKVYLGDMLISEGNENVNGTLGEMSLTFNKDNTFVMFSSSEEDGEYSEPGTYKLEGSALTLTYIDETIEFTVVELAARKLVLGMTQEENMEGMTVKIDVKLNFIRK